MTDTQKLQAICEPKKHTAAFSEALRQWLVANELDADTKFYALPLDARSEIMRNAARMVS
jgi:hypothetical protein